MPSMPDKPPSLPNGLVKGHTDIKAAEKRILSSTEHLNEILSLLALVNVHPETVGLQKVVDMERAVEASTSLVRIFARLRKHGKMVLGNGVPKESPQGQIVVWLNERYNDFVENLLSLFGSENGNLQVFLL